MSGTAQRSRHAVGRALVRLAGARATGRPPQQQLVAISAAGRPLLPGIPDLHVSVAHCGHAVVLAQCWGAEVGVDIERSSSFTMDVRRLAQRLFSDPEVASLQHMPDRDLDDWFLSAWTIKEAVGKALGAGVAPALSGVVTSSVGETPTLASAWTGPPAEDWTVQVRTLPDGGERVAVAVAVPAPDASLRPVTELKLEEFTRACRANLASMPLRLP